MRFFSALPLIFSLAFAPCAFAAQVQPAEQIYLESEVHIDEVEQFARDMAGIPINGTIQGFYPNGRLAWETQWLDGKLHGIIRSYHDNRQLKEETTWVNGKLHGQAKWYDKEGNLLRETIFENDKDLAAPR